MLPLAPGDEFTRLEMDGDRESPATFVLHTASPEEVIGAKSASRVSVVRRRREDLPS